ncbi:MAG: TatD family hydrolase, partial [Alphaproteobacteria bacterium]|nr:TatD family hydrolase [Alphaproteobacteria bacterium]MBX9976762.1 TatD family hydrolase [Alphaproteobacteria bacterium]
MFIDSHCHLNFEDYAEQGILPVIERARAAGVSTLLTICTKAEEADPLKSIAESYEHLFCTVGIHPHEAAVTLEEFSLNELRAWLLSHAVHPKVVGFGEAGLDYYYEHSSRDSQRLCFEKHLEAALEARLPLSIHTRDAEEDTIALITQYKETRGVIHCFTGSPYLRDAALALGYYISISGIVTFNKAQELRDTIKDIPLGRLLIETDAPFLAPVPFRGKTNEPSL